MVSPSFLPSCFNDFWAHTNQVAHFEIVNKLVWSPCKSNEIACARCIYTIPGPGLIDTKL